MMEYKLGDMVKVVNNESGGFKNGKEVEVVEMIGTGYYASLLLSDGKKKYWHVGDEVVLLENDKNN